MANGPMAEVTGNLGRLPDSDISAIATYLVSRMGAPTPERAAAAEDIRKELSVDQAARRYRPAPPPAVR
ncbi:hypothetical protein ACVOMV_32860 [Mesorhizobium atlanticum]